MTSVSRYLFLTLLLSTITFFSFSTIAFSQAIAITQAGESYTQDFNSLPKALSSETGTRLINTWQNEITLPGWSATVNRVTATSIEIDKGSSSIKGLKSLGSDNTSTERSLGSYGSGTAPVTYSARFLNATGKPLTKIEIAFDLQQWYAGKQTSSLKLEYQITGAVTPRVAPAMVGPVNGNKGILNGNVHQVSKKILLDIPILAPGQELTIRWIDETNGEDVLAIDNFKLTTAVYEKVFYSNYTASGDLNLLTSWVSEQFGTLLTSFTEPYQTFVVKAPTTSTSYELKKELRLPSSSKIVIGTGAPFQFTIPANVTLAAGVMDIAANTTVIISSDNVPALGFVHPTSTVIYKEASNQSIKMGTYGNLLIDGKSGDVKKLSQRVVVTGQLELKNGTRLETGDHDLVLQDTKKPVKYDATSFVVTKGKGRLKIKLAPGDSAIFPVGLENVLPIKLKLKEGSVADTFSVSILNGVYTAYENNAPTGVLVDAKVVRKTWVVDEHVPGGTNLDMTMTWTAADMAPDFNPESAYLLHYHSKAWDKGNASKVSVKDGFYSVTRSGITSFSPFAVAGQNGFASFDPTPLPVELLYFQAKRVNQQVQFQWATASEKDNEYFTLERSLDGKNFTTVGQPVKGAGTSAVALKYSLLLAETTNQTIYYRLKQTDYNGAFEYSKVIAVSAAKNQTQQTVVASVFPNPTTEGKVQLLIDGAAGPVSVKVYQGAGKEVFQKQATLVQGVPLELDLAGQPSGVYFLQVQTATSQEVIRLVKN